MHYSHLYLCIFAFLVMDSWTEVQPSCSTVQQRLGKIPVLFLLYCKLIFSFLFLTKKHLFKELSEWIFSKSEVSSCEWCLINYYYLITIYLCCGFDCYRWSNYCDSELHNVKFNQFHLLSKEWTKMANLSIGRSKNSLTLSPREE